LVKSHEKFILLEG